jgi:hypothetical protein
MLTRARPRPCPKIALRWLGNVKVAVALCLHQLSRELLADGSVSSCVNGKPTSPRMATVLNGLNFSTFFIFFLHGSPGQCGSGPPVFRVYRICRTPWMGIGPSRCLYVYRATHAQKKRRHTSMAWWDSNPRCRYRSRKAQHPRNTEQQLWSTSVSLPRTTPASAAIIRNDGH